MLNVHNLSIAFQGETLFEDITFKLGAGDRIGLIGKNGAGKSTMLKYYPVNRNRIQVSWLVLKT
jgi:ATP-binding cassette subfamily F protein 3